MGLRPRAARGWRLWLSQDGRQTTSCVGGIGHRPDRRLAGRLNAPKTFEGEIANQEYIGKSGDELVALWNLDHPDDPVVN